MIIIIAVSYNKVVLQEWFLSLEICMNNVGQNGVWEGFMCGVIILKFATQTRICQIAANGFVRIYIYYWCRCVVFTWVFSSS